MAPKREASAKRKHEESLSPRASIRDPTLPTSIPTTARHQALVPESKSKCSPGAQGFFKFLYNPDDQTVCERSCASWCQIITYSIIYLLFLSTYTMIFLYGSLSIIKATGKFNVGDTRITDSHILVKNSVGLSATPTSVDLDGKALIWYRVSEEKEYHRYISAIDELLSSRNNTPELIQSLGPCGKYPYGYGAKPCVIVRINKQLNWAGRPLSPNSTLTRIAPEQVQKWIRSGKRMLWLHCDGYDSYDREHIGLITYHPHPPGFDPNVYPLGKEKNSPLIAVQFSEFTQGVSLSIECKLWYEFGPSSVHFTLYIGPQEKVKKSVTNPPK